MEIMPTIELRAAHDGYELVLTLAGTPRAKRPDCRKRFEVVPRTDCGPRRLQPVRIPLEPFEDDEGMRVVASARSRECRLGTRDGACQAFRRTGKGTRGGVAGLCQLIRRAVGAAGSAHGPGIPLRPGRPDRLESVLQFASQCCDLTGLKDISERVTQGLPLSLENFCLVPRLH